MKSIIFLISFLFVGQLQAQDTTFKYVKTNEKKALAGLKSVMNSSAFVLNERTAAENYEIVYSYIASKYEYPEDVLMSNTPGIELTIQETIPGLYTMKSMGFVNSFKTHSVPHRKTIYKPHRLHSVQSRNCFLNRELYSWRVGH